MVIVSPDFELLGKGNEACMESYKSFANMATIQDFKETSPTIFTFGNTAVASYTFEKTYMMKGETFHDSGRDIFIFINKEDNWLAVWRSMHPLK